MIHKGRGQFQSDLLRIRSGVTAVLIVNAVTPPIMVPVVVGTSQTNLLRSNEEIFHVHGVVRERNDRII